MKKKIIRLLHLSFDTPLREDQRGRLDRALLEDPGLRKEKILMQALRRDIRASAYGPFSPGFTERVTARILGLDPVSVTSPDLFYEALSGSFRPMAWAGGLAILVLAVLHLTGGSLLPFESLWLLSDDAVVDLLELTLF